MPALQLGVQFTFTAFTEQLKPARALQAAVWSGVMQGDRLVCLGRQHRQRRTPRVTNPELQRRDSTAPKTW